MVPVSYRHVVLVRHALVPAWLLILAVLVAGCSATHEALSGAGPAAIRIQPQKAAPVILAAGDIASCSSDGDEATARLIGRLAGTVATLGDTAYEDGSSYDFKNCYAPSWGRFKLRTRPALGNHEYGTRGASGYFAYFEGLAGPVGKGWYSYRLGTWHVIVLNSNCAEVGGCDRGSSQARWLRADLASNRVLCTLAYWHHPLFSSGTVHGNDAEMAPIWQSLYEGGTDVVLNGHEHNYERFAPQTPDGKRDLRRGIREFVVGTGGASHYRDLGRPIPNSQVRNDDTFGVLRLVLGRRGYSWRFIPAAGGSFTDSGSARCHP
jgi:hypothetical protein